jgi:hypothetical protein
VQIVTLGIETGGVGGFVLGFLEVNNKIDRNGNSNFFIKENIFDEKC